MRFGEILGVTHEGKTDADLIYILWKENEQLKEAIKERDDVIREQEKKKEKLIECLTQEECKKAAYGDPAETLIYVEDIKKAVFGKTWTSTEAEEIFKKKQEEKNEPDRSAENDEGSSAE